MENKKPVIITIVVLLLINTTLFIIGFLNRDDRHPLEENPTHEFFYKGHLWFYNSNNELLSKYECKANICDYTAPTVDDNTYDINYYKNGNLQKLSLLNNKYTFLTDGSVLYLYDAQLGQTLQTYKSLKNYNTKIDGDYYIVQNTKELWGVLMVNDLLAQVIPFEYEFIGLPNDLLEGDTLKSDKFIVKKDNKWYIINKDNSAISGYMDSPIVDLTSNYIFCKSDNQIHIFNYSNYEYLSNFKINNYLIEDDYIGVITDNFLLVYKDLGNNYIRSINLNNPSDSVKFEKTDTGLNILVNDNIVETIAEN